MTTTDRNEGIVEEVLFWHTPHAYDAEVCNYCRQPWPCMSVEAARRITDLEGALEEYHYWFEVCPHCEGRDYATKEGEQVRAFCPVCQHSGFVRRAALNPTGTEPE